MFWPHDLSARPTRHYLKQTQSSSMGIERAPSHVPNRDDLIEVGPELPVEVRSLARTKVRAAAPAFFSPGHQA